MEVSIKTVGEVVVVDLSGEIDGKTAPMVQEQVVPQIQAISKLLLDMTKVPFMSSAGLRLMLLFYRQMAGRSGRIALVGLSDDIKDTMEATGFLGYFKLSDSVESGIAALGN